MQLIWSLLSIVYLNMPETCWDRRLTINFRLVASCWFSVATCPAVCLSVYSAVRLYQSACLSVSIRPPTQLPNTLLLPTYIPTYLPTSNPKISPERLGKTKEIFTYHSQSLGREFNLESPRYQAGLLNKLSWLSMTLLILYYYYYSY